LFNNQAYSIDCRITQNTGKEIICHIVGKVILDSDNKPARMLGTIQDITERVKAENLLRESEERFRTLIEHAPDGMELIDLDGFYVDVNSESSRQLGYSKEELLRMSVFDIDPAVDKNTFNSRVKSNPRGERLTFESIHKRKDGTLFPVEVIITKLNVAGTECILSVVRDITERKEAAKKLELYQNNLEELVKERTHEIELINRKLLAEIEKEIEVEVMLKEALAKEKELNELKSRFISTASHEFKTPLTTVLSSVELIQRYGKGWTQEKHNSHLDKIKVSVDHLTKIIDDVLLISRADDGRLKYSPERLDFELLCRQFIEDAGAKYKGGRSLNFTYFSAEKEIYIDPKLWRFIIVNLLTNAYKYSPERSAIDFSVSVDKKNIMVIVKDKGIGMAPDDAEHLFEPFFRARNSYEIEGTGLGLSIVKRSVDVQGGRISVKTRMGIGTAFEIHVPRISD
jgi:PAS domain S-box-containing protein